MVGKTKSLRTSRNREPSRSRGGHSLGLAPTIGLMGGAMDIAHRDQMRRAHELGECIARNGCTLITGACPGLPLAAACGAKQHGGMVVGISPASNLSEHVDKYHSPVAFHDVLIFTGAGLMGREVTNIRSSDMIVIVGGRSGTLGEFAIAYDEGKPIGVLTGMGGIGDIAARIVAACEKSTGAQVIYDADPRRLVSRLLSLHPEGRTGLGAPTAGEGNGAATLELDVVCGMRILPQAAVARRNWKGRRFVFCSTGCARQFDADPAMFPPEEACPATSRRRSNPGRRRPKS